MSSSDPDALARERASDPRCSVLLEAPAGSGKTTVLTERLLRLLGEVDEPEEILAITFTRKAAAQMRSRVLAALRTELDTNTAQGARLARFAGAARARARQRGWDLQSDPGRLRIQTIDSFQFRLASQLTVTAKSGGALVITERPNDLYERAARHALSAAHEDSELAADMELLFERLDNHWGNVQRLLAEMLRQRGHWLRYVLGHEPGALSARISASLSAIVRDHVRAIAALVPASLREEAGALPGVGPLGPGPECFWAWKRLASLTLTAQCEWRRNINKTQGSEYERGPAREALRRVIESLRGISAVRAQLIELSELPAARLSDPDAQAIESLSRVLRAAAAHLQAEFATGGRVDHTYVAGAARAALTDTGLPTDLALRTGLALRHILVDEFQDTSIAQLELLESLTASWQEGEGRTLFVVGDPMQSIYQFREAEVGLFLQARARGIGAVRLLPLRLTRNFRSVPGLIDWINSAFTGLFPQADDLRASAVTFRPSVAGRVEPPAGASNPCPGRHVPVEVRLFAGGDRAAETAAIVQRIGDLRARNPHATTAVLVASRAHAAPIITALEAKGIEAIGVDLVPLRELSIVRDLVALLKATSHLGDRTAWLTVLRAPWCGVSLPTLTVLSRRQDELLVWEAVSCEERLALCPPEDRARLSRLRRVLEAAFRTRESRPLADWLELTWMRLGGADAYPEAELRHARAFFSVLSERVASGEWSGTHDLASLLANLFAQPQPSTANPVQLMTIHRAKGLEFDHVFVPSLDRDLNRGREPLLRWLDLPRAVPESDSDLIMAPVPAIGTEERGDVSGYLKHLMSRRAAHEQVRLLYVAATRARETLQLSAAPKLKSDGTMGPRAGTLLAYLWPAIKDSFETAEAMVRADTQAGLAPTQMLRRLAADWTLAQLEPSVALSRLPVDHQSLQPPEFSWVGETARHIGTVVHAALEKLARLSELPTREAISATSSFYVSQLRRHGVPEADLQWAASVVIQALTATVSSEHGRWIFSPRHREARSEWALTGIAAGRLTNVVIDRSFIDGDGTRWVIDFKTSRHEGGGLEAFLEQEMRRYRAQLETYIALARASGAERVRGGLYFPLLDVFRELS